MLVLNLKGKDEEGMILIHHGSVIAWVKPKDAPSGDRKIMLALSGGVKVLRWSVATEEQREAARAL